VAWYGRLYHAPSAELKPSIRSTWSPPTQRAGARSLRWGRHGIPNDTVENDAKGAQRDAKKPRKSPVIPTSTHGFMRIIGRGLRTPRPRRLEENAGVVQGGTAWR